MKTYYTNERNSLMLIALMKAHNIKKVVVSPGTTNISFAASIQQDSFFEIYSSVDERSAAYIACGLAAETGEPVALSCTGATASRNYFPGLTEAYYRQLPILAITSSRAIGQIGNNIDQVTDRTVMSRDIAKLSIQLPVLHDDEDIWAAEVQINKALLELRRRGGGPVHINLTTTYSTDFSVKELPDVRVIKRFSVGDELPLLPKGRIGIFVGSHNVWNDRLTRAVDLFCEQHNGVVLCDQTSNYKGKYGVFFNLTWYQVRSRSACLDTDMIIHIGSISASILKRFQGQIWRVASDGEVRDTFRRLKYVFEMEEACFFESYLSEKVEIESNMEYYQCFSEEYDRMVSILREKDDAIPFSNLWTAAHMYDKLPPGCVLHLGILNSLRCWNYFKVRNDVEAFSNTGGFGIDGGISSMLGASLADKNKLYFGVFGDLAFFYDMNSIGSRHLGNNFRLMLINNGMGAEFKNRMNMSQRAGLGDDADAFIAAAGHYGNRSPELVRNYAENLGFKYLSASCKEEFEANISEFLKSEPDDKPILFEVFTDDKRERESLDIVRHLVVTT